uniref:Retrotransposon gag domain-containing protein n=1 Tax=Lactuca sativa TaxID=4236 RepID=A0A9R1V5B1_LACSA|nr:hypothetical protein LSAT_V11C600326000 [Lactuca sativa]
MYRSIRGRHYYIPTDNLSPSRAGPGMPLLLYTMHDREVVGAVRVDVEVGVGVAKEVEGSSQHRYEHKRCKEAPTPIKVVIEVKLDERGHTSNVVTREDLVNEIAQLIQASLSDVNSMDRDVVLNVNHGNVFNEEEGYEYIRASDATNRMSWDKFTRIFREMVFPRTTIKQLEEKFLRPEQGNVIVREYTNKDEKI